LRYGPCVEGVGNSNRGPCRLWHGRQFSVYEGATGASQILTSDLTLLARLGLRAGQVAGLTLDGVDCHHGELVIRGKGSRRDRLPLPVDVGEALAAYLSAGRPQAESRVLVLRVYAPIGPMGASNVTRIVGQACERAGVPKAGAHRLRHSAATAMLRAGAPLSEIGHVLRQAEVTTAIYAKVDRVALRSLARPSPGALA